MMNSSSVQLYQSKTTQLRASLFDLSSALMAWYIVHHQTLEKASLNAQNFCSSVSFCLTGNTPVSDAELARLLKAGVEILEDEEEQQCQASTSIVAALNHACAVLAACHPVEQLPELEEEEA